MTLSDEELALYAIREAQLILAEYVHPGPHDAEKTINELLSVLDRNDVVEAVDRLEAGTGDVLKTQKPATEAADSPYVRS